MSGSLLPIGSINASLAKGVSPLPKKTKVSPLSSDHVPLSFSNSTNSTSSTDFRGRPLNINPQRFEQLEEELQVLDQKVKQGVAKAQSLSQMDENHSVAMQAYIEENGSEMISSLLENLQENPSSQFDPSESVMSKTQGMSRTFLSTLYFVSQSAADTIDFVRFDRSDMTIASEAYQGLKGIEVGTSMLKLLGAAGSAVVVQSLINQANKEIELKQQLLATAQGDEKEKLEREIRLLTDWVKLHHYTLADQLKETAISALLAFPKMGNAICAALDKGSSTVGTLFGGFTRGVSILGSLYEWYKTQKDITKQEKWSLSFRNQGPEEGEREATSEKLDSIKDEVLALIDSLENTESLKPEEQKILLKNSLERLDKLGFHFEFDRDTLEKSKEPLDKPDVPEKPKESLKVLTGFFEERLNQLKEMGFYFLYADHGIDLTQVSSPQELKERLLTSDAQKEIHRQASHNVAKREYAQQLLNRQKEIYDKRVHHIQAEIQSVIADLDHPKDLELPQQKQLLQSSLEKLEKLGADFTQLDLNTVSSPHKLRELLMTEQGQREILSQSKQIASKSEVLSMSLRNSLKTFILKKAEIEKGFLNWELFKTKINFTAAVITAGLWIAMKTAVISGAAAGMVVSGYGMLVLAAVLLVAGLGYLYYKKPNVFKTMCKGVYVEVVLRKLPLAIQQYRRQAALLDILRVAENSNAIMEKIQMLQNINAGDFNNMPAEFQHFMKEQKGKIKEFTFEEITEGLTAYEAELNTQRELNNEKMDKLNTKVLELNASVERQEKSINGLQDQIREAGWKDYLRLLSKNKYGDTKPMRTESESNFVPQAHYEDTDTFASFLLSDEGLLQDPDILSILAQMDVDLHALRTLQPDEAKKETAKLIESFFSMSDRDLVHAIRMHKRKLKIASA